MRHTHCATIWGFVLHIAIAVLASWKLAALGYWFEVRPIFTTASILRTTHIFMHKVYMQRVRPPLSVLTSVLTLGSK